MELCCDFTGGTTYTCSNIDLGNYVLAEKKEPEADHEMSWCLATSAILLGIKKREIMGVSYLSANKNETKATCNMVTTCNAT